MSRGIVTPSGRAARVSRPLDCCPNCGGALKPTMGGGGFCTDEECRRLVTREENKEERHG